MLNCAAALVYGVERHSHTVFLFIFCAGGLDEALHTIIDTCREQGVPFVFALSRKSLGRCVNKAVPVSLVGIFNYDGAQVCEQLTSCFPFGFSRSSGSCGSFFSPSCLIQNVSMSLRSVLHFPAKKITFNSC